MGRLAKILETRVTAAWVGTFEAHITVEAEGPAQRVAFEALCTELGVKCVLIELAAGVHRSQPMTSSHHRGAVADVAAEVDVLRLTLQGAGFPILRVKLEALLNAVPGPVAYPEADPYGYFEFHAKVKVEDPARLSLLCSKHHAHLSRNNRKPGSLERFVTLRVYHVDRRTAEAKFDALLEVLADAGYPAIGMKREYTVYDGDIYLDAGWLESP